MKRFFCDCGQEIFFDNQYCEYCGRSLGFDVTSLNLLVIDTDAQSRFRARDGRIYKTCGNAVDFNACNWLIGEDKETDQLCYACQFNRTIPNQSEINNNRQRSFYRWLRLEDAKKRLIYSLLTHGLPIENGWSNQDSGLLFDFLEEPNTNEDTNHISVTTGYSNGVITINAEEADDVARVRARSALNERQRTVLGHFRHESGHYFWDKIFYKLPLADYFDEVFGRTNLTYKESLDAYYNQGPRRNWSDGYISAYASSHPSEDWAETWNHYLLIFECLETAHEIGLTDENPFSMEISEILDMWRRISTKLNQLNRSIGLPDAYPFVITSRIEQKILYVASLMKSLKSYEASSMG